MSQNTNNEESQDVKTMFKFKIIDNIGHYIALVLIIGGFCFFLKDFSGTQQQTLAQIQTTLTNLNETKFRQINNDGDLIKEQDMNSSKFYNSVKMNIPLEVLKEVKYFNETLNQRQNETLQLILYVVTFISIIATFFGYKTIKDIKDNAETETKRITTQYEETFKLLNQMTGIYKEDISGQTKELLKIKDELIRAKVDNEQAIQNVESTIKTLTNSSTYASCDDLTSIKKDFVELEQKYSQNNQILNQLKEAMDGLVEGKTNA